MLRGCQRNLNSLHHVSSTHTRTHTHTHTHTHTNSACLHKNLTHIPRLWCTLLTLPQCLFFRCSNTNGSPKISTYKYTHTHTHTRICAHTSMLVSAVGNGGFPFYSRHICQTDLSLSPLPSPTGPHSTQAVVHSLMLSSPHPTPTPHLPF